MREIFSLLLCSRDRFITLLTEEFYIRNMGTYMFQKAVNTVKPWQLSYQPGIIFCTNIPLIRLLSNDEFRLAKGLSSTFVRPAGSRSDENEVIYMYMYS